jgi:DNA-binding GntR family transcriptional regulator
MAAGEIVRAADLREQVYDALRLRIIDGAYEPGERLTEMQVSKEFGVSRTPAREALVMLTQAGLLQNTARGFALPVFSAEDIRFVFEIRFRIEPFAVGKIVRETDGETLRTTAGEMRTDILAHRDFQGYLAANGRIRSRMFALCSNPRLRQAIFAFEEQVHFIRLATLKDGAVRERSIGGNLAVITRLEEGDPAKAEAEMARLLEMAQEAALDAVN